MKRRLLSEQQVQEVVAVLAKVGALFEIVMVDLGLHTNEELEWHKKRQEVEITRHLTDEHHPHFVKQVKGLRQRLEAMSLPLYIQSVLLNELVYTAINHADTYFAFRCPSELGEYHWILDGKDKGRVTPWEEWWTQIVMPMLESKTFKHPMFAVEGGDYSHHERFRTELSAYKMQFATSSETSSFFDIRPVMTEHFSFSPHPEFGLEAVDILTNAVRRSCAGNFSRPGWVTIPRLMIHRREQCIHLIHLGDGEIDARGISYKQVMRDFRRGGRSMLPPEH